ncbi:conserved hypothetical protein [Methylobacterium sp. 4-46]|uniref:TadG family pilus assembly protein n=1 Tax=unclassified Methylobacterium TaxID=2615210 RepID=UPI000152DAF2|nr:MULTISPECIES: TadG family pilus assembly protein [Methylobacterium]ACA20187.1 conserved hypothetical protein [Methylobacterium sp. 4-46]WFT79367.1 TadG family pilus assembly protein [Methylobacterium nodulans]
MRQRFVAFAAHKQGGASIIGLFGMLIAVGFAAVAIDSGNLYYSKLKLQKIADAAALGAVMALPTSSSVMAAALDLVSKNTPVGFGTVSTSADIQIGVYDPSSKTFTPSAIGQNAVQVTTRRSSAYGNAVLTYVAGILGVSSVDMAASSVAVKYGGACVMVLEPASAGSLQTKGSSALQTNCPIQVNSSSATAARTGGSSSITASQICVVGNYSGTGFSPWPKINCPSLVDPLANVPEPAQPVCTVNNPSISSGVFPTNCTYSGTVSLSGNVTLQSGLYYFKSANISVTGSTSITGSGLTIFLDKDSTLNLSGSGTITLTAQNSGDQAGILIFQSRSTPANVSVSLGGTGDMALNGTLYAPSAILSFGGNSTYTGTSKYGYAIAAQILTGGSGIFAFNAFPSSSINPPTLKAHAGLAH